MKLGHSETEVQTLFFVGDCRRCVVFHECCGHPYRHWNIPRLDTYSRVFRRSNKGHLHNGEINFLSLIGYSSTNHVSWIPSLKKGLGWMCQDVYSIATSNLNVCLVFDVGDQLFTKNNPLPHPTLASVIEIQRWYPSRPESQPCN